MLSPETDAITDLPVLFVEEDPKWPIGPILKLARFLGFLSTPLGSPLSDNDRKYFDSRIMKADERKWFLELGKIVNGGRRNLFAKLEYWDLKGLQFKTGRNGSDFCGKFKSEAYEMVWSITLKEVIEAVRAMSKPLISLNFGGESAITHPSGSEDTLTDAVSADIFCEAGVFSDFEIRQALNEEAEKNIRKEAFLFARVFDPETGSIIGGCLTIFAGDIMMFYIKEGTNLIMRTVLDSKNLLEFKPLTKAQLDLMQTRTISFFTALDLSATMDGIKAGENSGIIDLAVLSRPSPLNHAL